jgi:phosphatidylserine decarboxylase
MGATQLISIVALAAGLLAAGYLFWRYFWFFRDPPRVPPAEPGILSPADGTVVYVRRAAPGEEVVSIKRGLSATIDDILREHVEEPKIIIGIFMSPLDVHFNRAPLDASVSFVHRHPSRGGNLYMSAMHWRTLLGIEPYHSGSAHIVQNERTVTHFVGSFAGQLLPLYVVQIGARTVNGIESWFRPGEHVARGQTFGMIRVGSQVDIIVPQLPALRTRVRPGDRVRAGETILIDFSLSD